MPAERIVCGGSLRSIKEKPRRMRGPVMIMLRHREGRGADCSLDGVGGAVHHEHPSCLLPSHALNLSRSADG
jgi:hypothetical protein